MLDVDIIQGGIDCKVLLFGPNFSGKSSILDTLQNRFNYAEKDYYESAGILGVIVNHQLQDLGQFSFKVTELAGQLMKRDNLKYLNKSSIRFQQNQYILFTYNRQSKEQFNQLEKALKIIKPELQEKFIYILGTFSDVDESLIQVSEKEGRKLATSMNGQYLSYSSKHKHKVKALFYSIASCQEFITRHPNNISELKIYIDLVSRMKREKEIALYQYKIISNQYQQLFRKDIIIDILKIITPINTSTIKLLENQPIYQFIFL